MINPLELCEQWRISRTAIYMLGVIHPPVFYSKRRYEDWTLSPCSVEPCPRIMSIRPFIMVTRHGHELSDFICRFPHSVRAEREDSDAV